MDQKKARLTEHQLQDREQRLNGDNETYLRQCGWEYTCDTPGSLWLWRRKYKGAVLLVSMQTALNMQSHFNSGVYAADE